MRILYHSAAPTVNTGYGRCTREIVSRLHGDGHEIGVQCMSSVRKGEYYWEGRGQDKQPESPVRIFPSDTTFGLGNFEDSFEEFDADFYFTHFDTWMKPARNKIADAELPYSSYVIVDHHPAPEAVVKQVLNAQDVVSMSKFAKASLEQKGVSSTYIPHGVSTDKFYPVNDPITLEIEDSTGGMRTVTTDDVFVFGMIAANHGDRKNIPNHMEAFNMFLDNVDEDALMYIHTEQNSREGYDLRKIQKEIGVPDRNIIWPNAEQYHNVGDEYLNGWYNAFDVLLNCSMGESWGLTITEAMSAGTPPVVTNFSSMPEQVGYDPYTQPEEISWVKDPVTERDKVGIADHGLVVNPDGNVWREKVSSKQYIVNPRSIFTAMKTYYDHRGLLEDHSEKAAKFVRNNYDWDDHVIPKFKDFFDRMEKQLV